MVCGSNHPFRVQVQMTDPKLVVGGAEELLYMLMHVSVTFPGLKALALSKASLKGFTFYTSDESSKYSLFGDSLIHLAFDGCLQLDDEQGILSLIHEAASNLCPQSRYSALNYLT